MPYCYHAASQVHTDSILGQLLPRAPGVALPLLPRVEADKVLQQETELPKSTQKHGQGHASTLGTNNPAQESGCGGSVDYRQGLQVLDLCLPGTSTFSGLTPAAGTDRYADSYLQIALPSRDNTGETKGSS